MLCDMLSRGLVVLFPNPSGNVAKKSSGKMENTGVPQFLPKLLKSPPNWSPHSYPVPLQSLLTSVVRLILSNSKRIMLYSYLNIQNGSIVLWRLRWNSLTDPKRPGMDPSASCLSNIISHHVLCVPNTLAFFQFFKGFLFTSATGPLHILFHLPYVLLLPGPHHPLSPG